MWIDCRALCSLGAVLVIFLKHPIQSEMSIVYSVQLPTLLARKVTKSIVSVCPSVRLLFETTDP